MKIVKNKRFDQYFFLTNSLLTLHEQIISFCNSLVKLQFSLLILKTYVLTSLDIYMHLLLV